ncbi:metabotropic glutamate receptor 3-like [Amphiura filiformis]|uniref:metabotropic glutamate receptor 3-like n=1 Tax=Amphiura filiformis TaxID=82378 RepID=UPI003B2211E6
MFFTKERFLQLFFIWWLPVVLSLRQFHHNEHGLNISIYNHQQQKENKIYKTKHVDQLHKHILQIRPSMHREAIKRRKRSLISENVQHLDDTAYLNAKQFAYAPGDYILGGLFAVHIPDSNSQLCAKVLQRSGMWVESVLYAIDVMNNNSKTLGETQLGFEIRDDCSDPNKALEEALHFVDVEHEDSECVSDEPQTIGVIGTGSSTTSAAVANLLGLFKVPQVSYSASSPILSDKQQYPYFLRTIASDINQAEVMSALSELMNWNYVAIVHTDDAYGVPGMEALKANLEARNVCVAFTFGLNRETSENKVRTFVDALKKNTKVQVVYTFCLKHDITRILQECQRQHVEDRTWIGSDSWGDSRQTVKDVAPVVLGMLGVVPKATIDHNFKKYLSELDPYTNTRNPWYKLTLGETYNCTFNTSLTDRKQCHGNETFEFLLDIRSEGSRSSFMIDAVYAFAHALDDMLRNCHDTVCYNNATGKLNLEYYLDYIKNVSFEGLTNPHFQFDDNGDPLAQYEIVNLQNKDGILTFEKVGQWDPTLGFEEWGGVVWKNGTDAPRSRCSPDCPAGNYIIPGKPTCCWDCHNCEANSISTQKNSLLCRSCKDGQRTNPNQTQCLDNPIIFLHWNETMGIILIISSGLGLIATIFCCVIYCKYSQTPTIKATSTELSCVLLFGIACCFSCTYLYIARPMDTVCIARVIMMGVTYSIYVGSLLTKTNRISRIFNRKLSDGAPSIFLNLKYQLLFILGIVSVQVVLQVVWLQLTPGHAGLYYYEDYTLLQCKYLSYIGPVVAIGYNLLLAILCSYLAFRIRKLPGQFNDSRGICFTMITCALILFMFLAAFFATDGKAESIICCFAFVVSGFAGLICMFLPKVHIVLLKPERNIRQSTMRVKSSATRSTLGGTITMDSISSSNQLSKTPAGRRISSTHQTPNTSDPDKDSNTIGDEEEEEQFMEEIQRLKEELKDMEMERDEAVAMANDLYKQLCEAEKKYEYELEKVTEECERERKLLKERLELEGLPAEVILSKLGTEKADDKMEKDEEESNALGEKHSQDKMLEELQQQLLVIATERDNLQKKLSLLMVQYQQQRSNGEYENPGMEYSDEEV